MSPVLPELNCKFQFLVQKTRTYHLDLNPTPPHRKKGSGGAHPPSVPSLPLWLSCLLWNSNSPGLPTWPPSNPRFLTWATPRHPKVLLLTSPSPRPALLFLPTVISSELSGFSKSVVDGSLGKPSRPSTRDMSGQPRAHLASSVNGYHREDSGAKEPGLQPCLSPALSKQQVAGPAYQQTHSALK